MPELLVVDKFEKSSERRNPLRIRGVGKTFEFAPTGIIAPEVAAQLKQANPTPGSQTVQGGYSVHNNRITISDLEGYIWSIDIEDPADVREVQSALYLKGYLNTIQIPNLPKDPNLVIGKNEEVIVPGQRHPLDIGDYKFLPTGKRYPTLPPQVKREPAPPVSGLETAVGIFTVEGNMVSIADSEGYVWTIELPNNEALDDTIYDVQQKLFAGGYAKSNYVPVISAHENLVIEDSPEQEQPATLQNSEASPETGNAPDTTEEKVREPMIIGNYEFIPAGKKSKVLAAKMLKRVMALPFTDGGYFKYPDQNRIYIANSDGYVWIHDIQSEDPKEIITVLKLNKYSVALSEEDLLDTNALKIKAETIKELKSVGGFDYSPTGIIYPGLANQVKKMGTNGGYSIIDNQVYLVDRDGYVWTLEHAPTRVEEILKEEGYSSEIDVPLTPPNRDLENIAVNDEEKKSPLELGDLKLLPTGKRYPKLVQKGQTKGLRTRAGEGKIILSISDEQGYIWSLICSAGDLELNVTKLNKYGYFGKEITPVLAPRQDLVLDR